MLKLLQNIPLGYYTVFTFVNFATAFTIFLIVFFSKKKSKTNKIFAAFSFSVAYWSLLYFFFLMAKSKEWAEFYLRSCMIGVLFMPSLFVHFVVSFLNLKNNKKFILANYILSILFMFTVYTPLYARDIGNHLVFPYWLHTGPIFHLALIHFGVVVLYSFYLMWQSIKKEKGIFRNQILYVFIGTGIGYVSGVTNFFCWYRIKIPPFLNSFVCVYVIMVAIAVLKYRLMDINIALTRAGIFAVVYTLVLGIPIGIALWIRNWLIDVLGQGWFWLPLLLGMALASAGPFIYLYFDRKAEERLLKEQRRYQNTLKQASMGMTRIRNLRRLLDLVTHIVTKTVKLAYAGIYLYNEETQEFILQVCRDKGRMPILKLTLDNPLISWMALKRQPLVYEELKRLREDSSDDTYRLLEENMRLLTATVVIPNFLEDRFLGFFVLGEKTSGQIYTPYDLNVFEVLAAQAALAIENAKFYAETQKMQEQIATAEKMATVGTMANGLSHQINNRFHALSLIAADTIDTIKMIDTSNCSPEVKETFSQITHALERVKANVIQGDQVVKGMLKYTRKGEEGFEALTLDQLLDSTLEMVQYKVKLSEIDLIRNYPKDHPKIKGNLNQLSEAFFNFIDNGYDATVERKAILKEPNYRGRLTFSAQPQENGMLLITIEDNGMGIKNEDKNKLFTPFFTTKVSSRQGTGLGLYVLRRLIEEFHKGKIWFESEYGKGTRFFLQLPIAREELDRPKGEL